MESYTEFCEGWIGGTNDTLPYKSSDLFKPDSLRRQYNQIHKAIICNKQRGAINNGKS